MSEQFLDNKYARIYSRLMVRAKTRRPEGPVEWHHVLPNALGGKDGEVVALTFREHFLAHWLLPKFLEGPARRKMLHALACMQRRGARRVLSGWQYAVCQAARREAQMGVKHRPETLAKMSATRTGMRRSDETRARISAAAMNRTPDEATKAKIGAASRSRRPESLLKMAESLRGNSNAAGSERTEENRAKISAGLKAFYARRREECAA